MFRKIFTSDYVISTSYHKHSDKSMFYFGEILRKRIFGANHELIIVWELYI